MICSECGTVNKDSAKFCKGCGNPLNPKNTKTNISSNDSNPTSGDKKLILICGTIIICLAIIAAAFVLISNNDGGSSDSNDYNSANSVSTSENVDSDSSSNIHIKYCDFYTGSSLSDKSYCSANIGTEHYGEKYKISVLYSNGGSNLNDGVTATKTVDEEGFLHIYTSNAFRCYPDKAIVNIYDADGNFLTEETYYLEETSGQQSFGH